LKAFSASSNHSVTRLYSALRHQKIATPAKAGAQLGDADKDALRLFPSVSQLGPGLRRGRWEESHGDEYLAGHYLL
jgi:hypothetical protein